MAPWTANIVVFRYITTDLILTTIVLHDTICMISSQCTFNIVIYVCAEVRFNVCTEENVCVVILDRFWKVERYSMVRHQQKICFVCFKRKMHIVSTLCGNISFCSSKPKTIEKNCIVLQLVKIRGNTEN